MQVKDFSGIKFVPDNITAMRNFIILPSTLLSGLFISCHKSSDSPVLPSSPYTHLVAGNHNFHQLDYKSLMSGLADSIAGADTSFTVTYINAGTIMVANVNMVFDPSYPHSDSILHFIYSKRNSASIIHEYLLDFNRYTNAVVLTVSIFNLDETDISYSYSY